MGKKINQHEEVDISEALWNENGTDRIDNDTYNNMLLEQYKIYVEMADRVSARRSIAHTFFITLHAFLLGAFSLIISHQTDIHNNKAILAFTLFGLLILCYAWWRLVQYFRRLNRSKQLVIAEMETRLPLSSFWLAERKAMGLGNPYNPLKRLEVTLPLAFGIIYALMYIYVLIL